MELLGHRVVAVFVVVLTHAGAALIPAARPLRVIGVQIDSQAGQTDANCERAERLIRQHPGFDLYVLPELSSNAYDNSVLANVEDHAQELESGTITSFFSRVAREVDAHICYGFLRRSSEAVKSSPRYSICQAVAAPDGSLTLAYEKMHLCDMGACSEVGYGLSPGSTPGIFTCNGVRVGVTVCYDLRFPELYRRLAWDEGCDLILHPSGFVRKRPATHHSLAGN